MNVAKGRGMCKTDGWDVLAVGTGLDWTGLIPIILLLSLPLVFGELFLGLFF